MSQTDGWPSRPTSGALSGLRVLDLASLYAAPFIATLLADQGADVIKVEPPGGDAYRAFPNRMWPLLVRSKRSVVLDLRSDEGTEAVRQLIPDTDVVVVNMPPGLLTRMGLDWPTLSAINPKLIYAHVSGYGLDGPYAARPGNGTLGEAFTGLTHMTGEPDGPPVLGSVPLGDAMTGYVGAFGVLAACYHRMAHDGRGQVVDINPVDSMLQAVGPMLTAYDEGSGEVPGRLGSRLPGAMLRNVFQTSDGHWVAISASTSRHVDELRALSGVAAEEVDLEDAVRRWLLGCERDAALSALIENRVPAANVNDARDLLNDEHLTARRAVAPVTTAEFGPVLGPAPAPRLLDTSGPVAHRTPDIGEHNAEVFGHG